MEDEAPAIDEMKCSPCELDHTMYRAIRSVNFVNADGIDGDNKAYWDNLSGESLDPELVKRSRNEEMVELSKHKGVHQGVSQGVFR